MMGALMRGERKDFGETSWRRAAELSGAPSERNLIHVLISLSFLFHLAPDAWTMTRAPRAVSLQLQEKDSFNIG